jgi:hypothetical protein
MFGICGCPQLMDFFPLRHGSFSQDRLRRDPNRAGPLGSGSAFGQIGAAVLLASIGVSVGCPRSGGADRGKYNYDEIVSRLKDDYSGIGLNIEQI